jgi:murein DD-endopeptidase MepM/ murein hydrolase activator NlpD
VKAFRPVLMVFLILLGGLHIVPPTQAQPQCGIVNSINDPVDTSVFQLVQDFGAPSPRHQGRYHTGEDWANRNAPRFGEGLPVYAIAAGRVTYSAPLGWGLDGGVIIIEHIFADNTTAYSQYGHITEGDNLTFPARDSCVQAGQVIGYVGNFRPAPHLHFEIRVNQPDVPGPGYTWEDPTLGGWRHPSRFIRNAQASLQSAFRWRVNLSDTAGPSAPPLMLEDSSLLHLDRNRLGRISPDGRMLWRITLNRPAIALMNLEGQPTLIYEGGVVQPVNLDGTLGETRETGHALLKPVLLETPEPLFLTRDGSLITLTPDLLTEQWRLLNAPTPRRIERSRDLFALISDSAELLTLSAQGQVLHRAQLRALASLDTSPDGTLLAYTRGGLWQIDDKAQWEAYLDLAPQSSDSGALFQADNGELYLFDGETLSAYAATKERRWQVAIPGISGANELYAYGHVLLLISNHGDLVVIRTTDGGICNRSQVFGDAQARTWHHLGEDGLLRIAISDQMMGFHWQTLLGGCAL